MLNTRAAVQLLASSIPAVCFLLTGCSSPKPEERPALKEPAPYVRVEEIDANHIQLQIAARKFVPTRSHGPAIWLTGVSHIGESNYYAAVQKLLDAQTVVLFEGISANDLTNPQMPGHSQKSQRNSPPRGEASDDVGGLQSSLAGSLGLVFQLTAVDYDRANFRNCDLSISELRQLLAQEEASSGSTGAGQSFEGVLQLMQGGSFFDSLLQVGLRFLGASPKLRALGRLALIDVIGEIQGDFSHLHGLPPEMQQLLEVLLQRRNQKVISELSNEIAQRGKHDSIAVFYGTGHMPDLEKRLAQQLHYRPSTQVWLTAFSVNLAQAGVSDSERQTVKSLIELQLKPFQATRPTSKVQSLEKSETDPAPGAKQ